MRTVEAVIGNWEIIFEKFCLPWKTGNKHIECPLCGKEKFRVTDYNGTGSWICTCGHGNGWDLIKQKTEMEFKDIAREIDKILGLKLDKIPAKKQNKKLLETMELWRCSSSLPKTSGQEYLYSRGCYKLPIAGVKYCQSIFDHEYGAMKGLLAIASTEDGTPAYRHVTYLDGNQKSDVKDNKKLLKLVDYEPSCAIKLFEHQTTLGIAEGIETALSCMQQFKCPTWSTLNTSIMKKFRAPKSVKHLIIHADNDKNGAGLAAAFECGHRNVLANNNVEKVTIKWTVKRGDFNDLIFNESKINVFYLER